MLKTPRGGRIFLVVIARAAPLLPHVGPDFYICCHCLCQCIARRAAGRNVTFRWPSLIVFLGSSAGEANLLLFWIWSIHRAGQEDVSTGYQVVDEVPGWHDIGFLVCLLHGARRRTTSRRFYDDSTGCPCVSRVTFKIAWSSSVWLARHRRIWQTSVSLLPTSARADSDQPTQLCASSDVQITVSATDVLQLLDHACGTRCQSIYGNATVSDSLNGCWRPICSVFGTAALCDALVRT